MPDDTLLMCSAPDFSKFRQVLDSEPPVRFWHDRAMADFRQKILDRWQQDFVKPFERECSVTWGDFTNLPQGQFTFAMVQNGWQARPGQTPGLLLLLDTRDKAKLLASSLERLRAKWVDAERPIRVEKIRSYDFLVLVASTNGLPQSVSKFLPQRLETHELGEEEPQKEPHRAEWFVGRVDSLLVVANSSRVVEQLLARLAGDAAPILGDLAAFDADRKPLFRDSPLYAWVNAKAFLDILDHRAQAQRENPFVPPNPWDMIHPEKLLAGLRSVALALHQSSDGFGLDVFFRVPESSREGLFKILAGEAKDPLPPAFVPADVLEFRRWRIDGQKAWDGLLRVMTRTSPEWVRVVNFILDTANLAAKQTEPDFDVRKNLIGNLGDDFIVYSKASRTGPGPGAPLILIGSPHPDELLASLKHVFIFMTASAGSPLQREFNGRKVYSVPLPGFPMPLPSPTEQAQSSVPRMLSYVATSDYVAFSTDASVLEEYLRSSQSPAKSLRDLPGLTDAIPHVVEPGSSFFGYDNEAESLRSRIEYLRLRPDDTGHDGGGLEPLSQVAGMTKPSEDLKDWMDFSLLPAFERVSKYFGFSVLGASASVDGWSYKLFWPTPTGLRGALR